MAHTLSGAVQAAIASDTVRPVNLIELDFTSGFVRVHTGVGDLTYDGDVYLGVGNIGSISAITEEATIQAQGISMTLSGIPVGMIGTALGEHYQGRDCKVWNGLLDEEHELIADPVGPYHFRMDTLDVEIGDTATISLSAENRLADWERPRTRRYTHEDQQNEFAGDMFYQFVQSVTDMELIWGRQ